MRRSSSRTIFLFSRTLRSRIRATGARAVFNAVIFTIGFVLALTVAGGCGRNDDENQPHVFTETVNGSVRIGTTGP
jgi:hypothetical protein